jgi:hypothetical protein
MAVGGQILLIRMPARAEWHPSGVPPPVIIHHSLGRRVWAFARTANHERPMRGAAARAPANPAPQSMYVRTYVRTGAGGDHGIDHNKNHRDFPTFLNFPGPIISTRTRICGHVDATDLPSSTSSSCSAMHWVHWPLRSTVGPVCAVNDRGSRSMQGIAAVRSRPPQQRRQWRRRRREHSPGGGDDASINTGTTRFRQPPVEGGGARVRASSTLSEDQEDGHDHDGGDDDAIEAPWLVNGGHGASLRHNRGDHDGGDLHAQRRGGGGGGALPHAVGVVAARSTTTTSAGSASPSSPPSSPRPTAPTPALTGRPATWCSHGSWARRRTLRQAHSVSEHKCFLKRVRRGTPPGLANSCFDYDALMMRRARHLLATAPQ